MKARARKHCAADEQAVAFTPDICLSTSASLTERLVSPVSQPAELLYPLITTPPKLTLLGILGQVLASSAASLVSHSAFTVPP